MRRDQETHVRRQHASSAGTSSLGHRRNTFHMPSTAFGAAHCLPNRAYQRYKEVVILHKTSLNLLRADVQVVIVVARSWQLTDAHHARRCVVSGFPWFCSITSVAALFSKNVLHSYTVHHFGGRRYSLGCLLVIIKIRQMRTVVVGTDRQNTTLLKKQRAQSAAVTNIFFSYLVVYRCNTYIRFFPACARIHSEINRRETPALVMMK